jgi:hypothetical protein
VTSGSWLSVTRLPQHQLRACLGCIAVTGLLLAWWRYPVENHFSVLTCTISFLGSPDPDRNPYGWRFFQVGMTALVLLLLSLGVERHRKLEARAGNAAYYSSALLAASLALVLVVTLIPDSREGHWFGVRTGTVHTCLAILAIPVMGCGIVLDGVALWRSGVGLRGVWPFHLYGLIVVVGMTELREWERICQRDPTLPHWPGQGIHSTPLWEWILFAYLVGYLVWMARGGPGPRSQGHGSLGTIDH